MNVISLTSVGGGVESALLLSSQGLVSKQHGPTSYFPLMLRDHRRSQTDSGGKCLLRLFAAAIKSPVSSFILCSAVETCDRLSGPRQSSCKVICEKLNITLHFKCTDGVVVRRMCYECKKKEANRRYA